MQFLGASNTALDSSLHSLPAAANAATHTCSFPRTARAAWMTTVSKIRYRHKTSSRVSMSFGKQQGEEGADRRPVADVPKDGNEIQRKIFSNILKESRPAELARLTALLGSLLAELEEKKRLSSGTPVAKRIPEPDQTSTSSWRPEDSAREDSGGRDTRGGASGLPEAEPVINGRKFPVGLDLVNRAEALESEKSIKAFKGELSGIRSHLQELVIIAKELAYAGPQGATRKINGKFVGSHILARLEDLHEVVSRQAVDVDAMDVREVPLTWTGMAEDVRVMGSFDGWTEGAQLSPEELGTPMRFGGCIKLRPGRYELKFLVDGEWRLAQEWPMVGSGLAANNLLVVE